MNYLRIVLILTILGGLLIFVPKYYKDHKRDSVIKDITSTEAEIRSLCSSNNLKSRLKCFTPKLEEIAVKDFSSDFVAITNGERIALETKEFKGHIRIKRIPGLGFGGKCISSFYFFDFDGEYIFISKDNKSGIIHCQSISGEFTIANSQMLDSHVKKEVETIKSLSF